MSRIIHPGFGKLLALRHRIGKLKKRCGAPIPLGLARYLGFSPMLKNICKTDWITAPNRAASSSLVTSGVGLIPRGRLTVS